MVRAMALAVLGLLGAAGAPPTVDWPGAVPATADAAGAAPDAGGGPGLFVVGLEANGALYLVRLRDGGGVEL